MDHIKRKLDEFNKRWEIIDDSSYEVEFQKFKTRIINIFKDIDCHIGKEGIQLFCNLMGIEEKWHRASYASHGPISTNIIDTLTTENNEKKFYRILQIIFHLPIKIEYEQYGSHRLIYSKDLLYEKTKQAIEFSRSNLTITRKDDEIILYPKGEKEFDYKLVDQVLSFLNEASQKHFIDALKFYETAKPKDAIQSAEELRRTLEEFLRFKLKNQHGLDKNITELLNKLKQDSRDSVIRNIIFQVFTCLDKYFNENSKHKDGDIDNIENEFLIYQVGILLRYIHFTLK